MTEATRKLSDRLNQLAPHIRNQLISGRGVIIESLLPVLADLETRPTVIVEKAHVIADLHILAQLEFASQWENF